jgi:hypothetical protein
MALVIAHVRQSECIHRRTLGDRLPACLRQFCICLCEARHSFPAANYQLRLCNRYDIHHRSIDKTRLTTFASRIESHVHISSATTK